MQFVGYVQTYVYFVSFLWIFFLLAFIFWLDLIPNHLMLVASCRVAAAAEGDRTRQSDNNTRPAQCVSWNCIMRRASEYWYTTEWLQTKTLRRKDRQRAAAGAGVEYRAANGTNGGRVSGVSRLPCWVTISIYRYMYIYNIYSDAHVE